MLKKITLLAMATAALVAFAAPSAKADEWYTGETKIGESEEEGDAIHVTGSLSYKRPGLKVICQATANVHLWNVVTGRGKAVTSFNASCTVSVFTGSEYVNVPGCSVNPSTSGEEWPISTSGSTVSIEEVNYSFEFQGCAAIGIPNGFKVGDEGTATGTMEGECIVFNNSGDLSGGTLIDGALCPTISLNLSLR